MSVVSSELLLKIYKTVVKKVEPKKKPKYPPARKSYNIHTFG